MSASADSPKQYPVACASCKAVKGFPFQVRTLTDKRAVEVKLRCRDCGHEWIEIVDSNG